MSGVFGCWHLDRRPLDVGRFQACFGRISPAGAISSATWHDGPIGLGYKSNWNAASAKNIHAKDVACVFDGRLDNRDELLSAIGDRRLHPGSADSDVVRTAYELYGADFVKHITGDFVCAVFDSAAKRLLVARDRLGVRPVCFTEVDHTFLFATEAKALLAWPGVHTVADELMLADFVLQFVSLDSQNRTFFRDIRSVPAAHVLTVQPRGTTLHRYFDFDTERRVRRGAIRNYVGDFHQVVTASVRKRLRHPAPVAVSVSGGLDSAYIFSIAARLVRDGVAPCPSVLGCNYSGAAGTPSDEEDFVRAIERSSGETIERVPQRPGFMQVAADDVWHAESPLVDALACQRQALFQRAREIGAGRLLTGHWGDQLLFDTDYLVDLWRSRQWSLLEYHAKTWDIGGRRLALRIARDLVLRYGPEPLVRAARRVHYRSGAAQHAPWYTKRFRTLLRERFEDPRLTRLRGTSHAWAIYQQCRRGYHVQCMEWNSRIAAMQGLEIAFPYLDCDLIQLLMSIPGEIQSYDGVPRGLMRLAMRGVVPDSIVDRRSKGEFTDLANRSIGLDFSRIADLLGPSSLAVRYGFLDGPVLWSRLGEWRTLMASARTATLANRLIDLCGLELLLRAFTPRSSVDIPEGQLSVAQC